jgi:octaprenyl-diphosphate synthase
MPSNPAVAARLPSAKVPGATLDRDALAAVYALAAADFAAVNSLIPRQLTSNVALVEEIGHHIVESGGKRLRPLLVLLGTRCCNYQGDAHVRLATIIEFLHTATLLHDDVVDHSKLRRGQATANALWGNSPSVLVGDFLYSRAFQLMVDLDSMDIMAILSDATNTIAEGEVLQLANVGNCAIDESHYMDVIRCKTAMLFQAATHTAGVLASEDPEEITALRNFGLHFGLAYQLVDDWLDYVGDTDTMGKNVGDDLAEGKLTLPLIYALANARTGADVIRQAIAERSTDRMDDVLRIVQTSGALDYTHQAALAQSERAIGYLATLPDNEYRDALHTLARFCVDRLR